MVKNNSSSNDKNRSLKVVFVLDTTVSMNRRFDDSNNRILDSMNKLVEKFLLNIQTSADLYNITEVAFITFSEGVTMETDFYRVRDLNQDCFKAKPDAYAEQKVTMKKNVIVTDPFGGPLTIQIPQFESIGVETYSRVGAGVIRALEKLDEKRKSFEDAMKNQSQGVGDNPYVPVMVVISDGAPDEFKNGVLLHTADPEEEKLAKAMVKSRCYSEGDATKLVFPIICAIGDEKVRNQMWEYAAYSEDYQYGFQYIDENHEGSGFEELIVKIGQSLTKSISLAEEKEKERKNREKALKEKHRKTERFRATSFDQDLDDAMLLRRNVQR